MDPFVHTHFQDDRFWSKVNFDGPKTEYVDTPCWVWTAGTNSRYGIYLFELGGQTGYAHRYSWERAHQTSIPKGLEIDHLCFTVLCVRPNHLEAVTQLENKRRYFATIIECPQGHPYGDDNTVIREAQGYNLRYCKACDREFHMRKAREQGARPIGSFRPHNSKLTYEDAIEIRAKYVCRTYPQSRLAKEYGVSQTAISAVILGKVWNELRDDNHAE